MPNFLEIPPSILWEGFGCFWKHMVDFEITILRTHDRSIHCHVKDTEKDRMWLVTAIYGYPQQYL